MALVKLDEDLSPRVAEPLISVGHDVRSVRSQGLGGADDQTLWRAVRTEGAMLVTGDKGFADIRAYPPGTHPGVVLLRPDSESLLAYCDLVQLILDRYKLEDLYGTVTVATPKSIRVRRAKET